jgi:hypothetical protein
MNEQDFRAALRQTMAVQEAPPPMSDVPVLEAAYRDRKRRRAMWAGASSAAVVAAIAIGVAVLTPGTAPGGGIEVGGQPSTSAPAETNTGRASASTPSSGPEAEKAADLATALDGVLPAGYESPADLKGVGDLADTLLKQHQAAFVDNINGTEVWSYLATAPLTKDERVGMLEVRIYAPGWPTTGEGCALTPAEWGAGNGDCGEQTVEGKKIPVVDTNLDGGARQWAAYRHADGTLVFVMQSTSYRDIGTPVLESMPLTATQLAALAVDPRFNVD